MLLGIYIMLVDRRFTMMSSHAKTQLAWHPGPNAALRYGICSRLYILS